MNTDFESDLDLLGQTLPTHSPVSTASPEPLRMRCPNCKKLYSVESRLVSADDLTKFECVDCQTSFFAMRPEFNGAHFLETHELETQFAPLSPSLPMIDGFLEGPASEPHAELERVVRSSVVQVPTATRECPNCHTLNALSNTECTKCEVIIAQFRPGGDSAAANDLGIGASGELLMMWEEIQDNYQDLERHEAFLARCAAEQRLVYAAHKYAQILAQAPTESIARLMRARVQGMASYGFDAQERGLGWATWSFPLPSFNSFIIFLGTILVAVGFGFPNMSHTAGLGFAMIALAIALRFFLRRPR